MTRYLYLARHGEAAPDGSGLTDDGRRQATPLGERLKGVPFTAVHHGPLPRAAQTARLIGASLPGVPLRVSEVAGDYVPYVPGEGEPPAEYAAHYKDFFAGGTRAAAGRPASVMFANDMSHLPSDLRWTGFPKELRA